MGGSPIKPAATGSAAAATPGYRPTDAQQAEEVKKAYKDGVADGHKHLDQWKDRPDMSLNKALAHAKREAPHTITEAPAKEKSEEEEAQKKEKKDMAKSDEVANEEPQADPEKAKK